MTRTQPQIDSANYYRIIRPLDFQPDESIAHIRDDAGDITVMLPDGERFDGQQAVDYAKQAIDSGFIAQMIVTVDAADSPFNGGDF